MENLHLLEFLFGEAAGAAQQAASERLLRWCQAFEDWLAERRLIFKQGTEKTVIIYWRRLLGERRKPPWELTTQDIEAHRVWLEAEGYSPNTIYNAIGCFAAFYRWCGEHEVDPQCGPGFNPAAQAPRPMVPIYLNLQLLSRGEVRALLGVLERDHSPIGRRDRAFFLARLTLGVSLDALRRLEWGQIQMRQGDGEKGGQGDREEAWVRWRVGTPWRRLPDEVWGAIREYLEASGRLEGMQAGKYIFAPLVSALRPESGIRAQDWGEDRPVVKMSILESLKLYGRLAEIPEKKLTLRTLLSTVTRLKLDEGASPEEMKSFLDSSSKACNLKCRLSKLPPLPEDGDLQNMERMERIQGTEAPVRIGRTFLPGDARVHGYYSHIQPAGAVQAVLAEDIHGIDEELAGLRTLGRMLLEQQVAATGREEVLRLAEGYTNVAYRVGEMLAANEQIAGKDRTDGGQEDQKSFVERWLDMMDAAAASNGRPPMRDSILAEALGGPALAAATRHSAEEIAGLRYTLRKVFDLALAKAQGGGQPGAEGGLVHLADIYGRGCLRLVSLLKNQASSLDLVEAYLRRCFDQALSEVVKELGLK